MAEVIDLHPEAKVSVTDCLFFLLPRQLEGQMTTLKNDTNYVSMKDFYITHF